MARAFSFTETRAEAAAWLLAKAQAMLEEIGLPVEPWLAKRTEETLKRVRARLDVAALAEAQDHGRALTVEEAITLAFDTRS